LTSLSGQGLLDRCKGDKVSLSYVGELTLLAVIDVGNGNFTLGNVVVVVNVVTQMAHICGQNCTAHRRLVSGKTNAKLIRRKAAQLHLKYAEDIIVKLVLITFLALDL
jgi:hypothetical protein